MGTEEEPEEKPAAKQLEGPALVKEVCRLIREARSEWDAHNNASCRRIRGRALRLYLTLTAEQKDQIPQVLRVWLRYRSEKYFGHAKNKPKKKARSGARKKVE
jgi:hypothetical protein